MASSLVAAASMASQTPAHDLPNPDLLAVLPVLELSLALLHDDTPVGGVLLHRHRGDHLQAIGQSRSSMGPELTAGSPRPQSASPTA